MEILARYARYVISVLEEADAFQRRVASCFSLLLLSVEYGVEQSALVLVVD